MARARRRVFQPIRISAGLEVTASGGLVEIFQQPYREPAERRLSLAPALGRKVAQAMLRAADAAEGKPEAFKGAPESEA